MSYNYVYLHWKRFGRQVENIRNRKHFIKKYNDYHQVVHEIGHMSHLHVDSSFYRQSMKIDNYFKITEWMDYSIGQQ